MSLDACAEITRKGDPDRFLSVLAAPPAARNILFPIYAFNVEVARAPWVTQEPMIAEMRLQWWRDALAEIGEGGVIRGHEVVTELAHVLPAAMVPVLDALVSARRWDVYSDPFESADHFDEYLAATSGGLMRAAGVALGAPDDAALGVIGTAQGLANFWRAVPTLIARGRAPLFDPQAISSQAIAARTALRRARRAVPRAARPASRAAWLAGPVLTKAARNPAAIAEGRLEPSEFARRLGLLRRVSLNSA